MKHLSGVRNQIFSLLGKWEQKEITDSKHHQLALGLKFQYVYCFTYLIDKMSFGNLNFRNWKMQRSGKCKVISSSFGSVAEAVI